MQPIKPIISAILVFCCAACFPAPAFAGPSEDAEAAYNQQDYKTALQLWQPLAAQGDANAQYRLGLMYDNGLGVKKDYRQAVEWFRSAALQGNAAAERHYEADNFVWQLGLPAKARKKTTDKMIAALANSGKKISQKDIPPRILNIEPAAGDAVRPLIQPAPASALMPAPPVEDSSTFAPDADTVKKLNYLAGQGLAEAQRDLGLLYATGDGVAQDYEQAIRWYAKAAAQGDAEAQERLGALYNSGIGVNQDYPEAARLFHLAADQGNAKAQNELGALYIFGHGVPQDYAQAAQWYEKAAAQGNADAREELGTLYAGGLGVPQDYAEAKKWFQLAAAQGNTAAQDELDTIYAYGLDAPPQQAVSEPEDPLAFVAGGIVKPQPAPSPAGAATKQISLATQQGFDVAAEVSQYRYTETNDGLSFVAHRGDKLGAEAGYTYVLNPYNAFMRAEGRFAGGPIDYSSASGVADGQPDNLWELRGLEGVDMVSNNFSLSPYVGFGYRALYNDARGPTNLGLSGYRRESHYRYIPVGATERLRLEDGQTRLAANLEYDFFAGGSEKSYLNDSNPALGDIVNHQRAGNGARGSILYETTGWSAGPWFNIWHIRESDTVPIPGDPGMGGAEPDNQTTEFGIKIVKNFW